MIPLFETQLIRSKIKARSIRITVIVNIILNVISWWHQTLNEGLKWTTVVELWHHACATILLLICFAPSWKRNWSNNFRMKKISCDQSKLLSLTFKWWRLLPVWIFVITIYRDWSKLRDKMISMNLTDSPWWRNWGLRVILMRGWRHEKIPFCQTFSTKNVFSYY